MEKACFLVITLPFPLPESWVFLRSSLWEPGQFPGGKACEKVGPPKKWPSEMSYSHTCAHSISSNCSTLSFSVPSSLCSHSFCSRSGNLGYASLDASVSPDFKMMFALWPQYGSKENLDFSVCSAYFCCKDRCDIFQVLYILELKPEVSFIFSFERYFHWDYNS